MKTAIVLLFCTTCMAANSTTPDLYMNTAISPNACYSDSVTFGSGEDTFKISWRKGVCTFEGNMDDAAKKFFEFLKPYMEGCIQAEVDRRIAEQTER